MSIKRYKIKGRDIPVIAIEFLPDVVVCANDHDEALAAKDARIAELEGVLAKALAFTEANTFGGTDALELIEECHAALASKQQAEPTMAKNANVAATHSEDGRDSVQVVAFLMKPDFYEPYVSLHRDSQTSALCEQLMTVAQHERIVDAYRVALIQARSETPVVIDTQPARQVGGDERKEAFEAYPETGCDWGSFYQGWKMRAERAALAPAAVVVDLSDDEIVEIMRPELNPADGGYVCDTGSEELVKGIRLVIARLNRRAIPVGLLERAAYLLELGELDGPTARELRALLGKGD